MKFLKKLGPIGVLGLLVFTPAVILLLVYLHSREPEVPAVLPQPEHPAKKVWVCDGAPPWVAEHLPRVVKFWAGAGCPLKVAGAGPCTDSCVFDFDGVTTELPCKAGNVAIVARDAWADPSHAGDTFLSEKLDPVVRLPAQIEVVDPTSPGAAQGAPIVPDLAPLLLAHELGHALNLGHSTTVVGEGLVAHKTGEVMNPVVTGLGWGTAGISCD